MSEQAAPATQTPEQLEQWVASQLTAKVKRDDIIRELIRQGMNTASAMQLVTSIERTVAPAPAKTQKPKRRSVRESYDTDDARAMMLNGLLIFGIGTALTVGGYVLTEGHGYLLFWGAILFGFIRLLVGFIIWLRVR